jgi:hypothetical protein
VGDPEVGVLDDDASCLMPRISLDRRSPPTAPRGTLSSVQPEMTASGDAFTAALTDALLRLLPYERAAQLATAAAGSTVSHVSGRRTCAVADVGPAEPAVRISASGSSARRPGAPPDTYAESWTRAAGRRRSCAAASSATPSS